MTLRPRTFVPHALVLSLITLAATGCATGYGAKGLTGGYSDERIDDTHFLVRFQGNGYASKERVWNFWFHRCAELTAEKGFAYFDLQPAEDRAKQGKVERPTGASRHARHRPDGGGLVVPAGYTYYYVPGSTVTTWNSSAVVAMFRAVPAGRTLFSAQRVVEMLGAYIRSNGSETPPDRKKLFRGSLMKLGASQAPERIFPDGVTIGYVDMHRVLDEVADGKAARARIKASLLRKQSALDAGKAQLDKLRKAYDAESNATRRAAREAEIAAKKKQLQELLARSQAELTAEEQALLRPIVARVGPVVERVRSAQHLDTVTEERAGGLWDADITADVIRLYQETYAVHGST
jgi:Skp family chaperone for outer membrane proteins